MKNDTSAQSIEFRFVVTLYLLSAALVAYAIPIPVELVSSDLFSLVVAKMVIGLVTATVLTPVFVISSGVTKLRMRKVFSR